MRQKKTVSGKQPAEDMIWDIRRATRRHFSYEGKVQMDLNENQLRFL
jgi:ribosomal protein L31E